MRNARYMDFELEPINSFIYLIPCGDNLYSFVMALTRWLINTFTVSGGQHINSSCLCCLVKKVSIIFLDWSNSESISLKYRILYRVDNVHWVCRFLSVNVTTKKPRLAFKQRIRRRRDSIRLDKIKLYAAITVLMKSHLLESVPCRMK